MRPSEAPSDAPTLSAETAELLMARLEALAQAARVFGSGLAGVDVHVSWSLHGENEEIRWTDPGSGRPRVRVQLDLSRMIELLRSETDNPEAAYLGAFKAGFLHELGHILYSGQSICAFTDPERDPLACVALDEDYVALAATPGVREVLRQICLTLEDARVERRLTGSFRGARRFLEGHTERALEIAQGLDARDSAPRWGAFGGGAPAEYIERLVAVLFLQVWGLDDRIDGGRVPQSVMAAAERLRSSLGSAVDDGSPLDLATWVGRHMLPEIKDSLVELEASDAGDYGLGGGAGQDGLDGPFVDAPDEELLGGAEERRMVAPGAGGEGFAVDVSEVAGDGPPEPDGASKEPGSSLPDLSRQIEERFAAPDLLVSGGRGHRLAAVGEEGKTGLLDSQIIAYPHMDGRIVLDELPVAFASKVPPSGRTSEVARDVVEIYGPMALAAFAGEAAALRRAFQVNHERRLAGRHRSGKRVGVSNIRRFVTSEDLRLFQKMEVPDRLSYYFHLLVDVSPSMLTNKNAQKAVATAYAFADALDRLRVPVDVTLYSSAVTVLYDHRVDALDLFFGGAFGYLSSGTHEIEAIAYAKQKADSVTEERKIVVVVTDGQPNSLALQRAGSTDLREYYRAVLIPWLAKARIDLMAVGIGTSPSYHRDSVSVSSSWESIGVLMRLLDDIIARGDRSHSALWA